MDPAAQSRWGSGVDEICTLPGGMVLENGQRFSRRVASLVVARRNGWPAILECQAPWSPPASAACFGWRTSRFSNRCGACLSAIETT
jgi:hypothetical protein